MNTTFHQPAARSLYGLATCLALAACAPDADPGADGARSATASQTVTGGVTPSGPYTDWAFAQDLYNLDAHITINTAPGPSVTEFWSTQFSFAGGNGGYMGLQNAGQLPGGGAGKMFIVSIWDSIGASPQGGASCVTFVEGGTGYSCRLAYDWVPGHDYRTRAWVVGPGQWLFALADMTTGVEIPVGTITVPGSWGWISHSWVVNWTEYFAANNPSGLPAQCTDLPLAEATFSLEGNDKTLAPTLLGAHVSNADCHNVVEALVSQTAVRQSLGGTFNSWLSPGQSLAPGGAVWSPDGRTMLVHQTDGNVVIYHDGRALWATKTSGRATSAFVMQEDGNLVLYSATNAPLFYTSTSGTSITSLAVQDDCNVVLYENGVPVWASWTNGCVSRL